MGVGRVRWRIQTISAPTPVFSRIFEDMRVRKLNTDQVMLTTFRDIDRFENAIDMPRGYVVVKHGDIPIDTNYYARGSDTTIICFHGAVEKDIRVPWFAGGGVTANTGANRFSISDPSIHLYDQITLGWHAGNHQIPELQGTLVRMIRAMAEKTGTKHLVFFGSSGGGFAALAMSRHFPGSLALPMNPQTSIGMYNEIPVNRYLEHAWPDVVTLGDLPGTVAHDLVQLYSESVPNWIGYIQNRRDTVHIRSHLNPFAEAFAEPGRMRTLWGEWGVPGGERHVAPPRELTASVLEGVAGAGGEWERALAGLGFDAQSSR